MNNEEWLKKCQTWTPDDDVLFEIGQKSGTALNRFTGKPITKEDIIKLHESLPY